MNPLIQLQQYKQSPWYDYISRTLITSGGLSNLVANDGLMGMTSNPSIFEKAIGGSLDYDPQFKEEVAKGVTGIKEIYEALVIRDIQSATDILLPVYQKTGGTDGFVSLEVSPDLAYNTQATVNEAVRLHQSVNRKNLMIKVPATDEGIPAIEYLLGEGININITLLFGIDAYEKVARAYISALTKRVAAGLEIRHIASVASFFISRIDSLVDTKLQGTLAGLTGKVAIANARLAYALYQDLFESPIFENLAKKGAQTQRLLWASTSAKDPRLPDVYYVEGLIAPNTVNTLPAATFSAYKDHGKPSDRFMTGLESAKATMTHLANGGIDFNAVTQKLIVDGVALFANAFDQLMGTISVKRENLLGDKLNRQGYALGSLAPIIEDRLKEMQKSGFVKRLWRKDPSLWHDDPAHHKTIKNAMGWLSISHDIFKIKQFSKTIWAEGFKHVVVLGMGGSSLAPEVLRKTFGIIPGYPKLHILDSTVPAQIKLIEGKIDISKSLFIVASKSGSTIEPLVFYQYFFEKVKQIKGDQAGQHFIAITDPASLLEKIAQENNFRAVFPGMTDIGGRYSALSNFGMVPVALMGVDIETLLNQAELMRQSCDSCVPPQENPGVRLGAILGELALQGKDKVTFITSKAVKSLGAWLEQLIAESTGKEGLGIIPIDDEPIGTPVVYGQNRLFVYIRHIPTADKQQDDLVNTLQSAGHPIVRIELSDIINIGEEFFLWEIATAVAGSILKINAFDQPNVQESKNYTNGFLDEFKKMGQIKEEAPVVVAGSFKIWEDGASGRGEKFFAPTLESVLSAHFAKIKQGDYVAINAYLPRTHDIVQILQTIRAGIRDKKQVATTLGFGPRFLHSTGQLHKGGPNMGVFLQITADMKDDIIIPGEPYTFRTLAGAQALGDYTCLLKRNRRVIRVHITGDLNEGLNHLKKAIEGAIAN
ncbi:MAG: bifunctional transaldolase/phosoglucose isomerase [Nitrospirae bacterium]|nr:bifunctional transaldolase/phosoglucose isomerase [Candidatus Troglogloeales bacterium]MBI3597849.1 bifunctional transaldolase/phosoglucose isomerase [Candidatus Troglogloeales bacterium]